MSISTLKMTAFLSLSVKYPVNFSLEMRHITVKISKAESRNYRFLENYRNRNDSQEKKSFRIGEHNLSRTLSEGIHET